MTFKKQLLAYESMWISHCPMLKESKDLHEPGLFDSYHRLATPLSSWKRLKIGRGTPTILTKHDWLIIYHGVSETCNTENETKHLCYSTGVI